MSKDENPASAKASAGEVRKSDVAKMEEEVLKSWQDNEIFEKSLAKDSPEGEFVFYDGPPFATGLPHYGSLLPSVVKDLFGRYKTMRGYHVRRRWGWDCHGLPIENMVEKQLGIKEKKAIEEMGIESFNNACQANVLVCAEDWEKYVDRIGRWVEFRNSYKTMDPEYTESVWWALKQINDKGLLYEGHKVLLYCPRCETPIAKSEIAMDDSYKDVTEDSVTISFKVTNPELHKLPAETYILAWTTTPWTLPGNLSLSVGPDIDYVVVEKEGKNYILAKERLEDTFKAGYDSIEREVKGKDIVGLYYKPLFDLKVYKDRANENTWKLVEADFVVTDEGTGVVHSAVVYGEEDYEHGLKLGLPVYSYLDQSGHFTSDGPDFVVGQYFKKAQKAIMEDLDKRGHVFATESTTHSYPHCYRCDTALYYTALGSWFINIQKIKDRLLKLNEKINWVPEHLKFGRFHKSMEAAPDWTISRNRFWASPLPIWKCEECKETRIIGSLNEILNDQPERNTYTLMRHGQSEGNVDYKISSVVTNKDGLTKLGKDQVKKAAEVLKGKGITKIIASDFQRTKETAEIIREALGLAEDKLTYDKRLWEMKIDEKYEGKNWDEYDGQIDHGADGFTKRVRDSESHDDLRKRTVEFMHDIDKADEGEHILVISHGSPLAALSLGNNSRTIKTVAQYWPHFDHFGNAVFSEYYFKPFPHNKNFELDLHRPYIDEFKLKCKCGKEMNRIPEVVDCWVESGSMPFAEYHYPFENKEEFEKNKPGDFIAEYIAQTRTWFYYMHVISTILFDDVSYKNVVTTGNILAEDGNKMSKSKGNYTDPMENLDKYGADALRYYMMSSVVMQAEDVKFVDDEIKEVSQRLNNILSNVVKFYLLSAGELKGKATDPKSTHVLDQWIIIKLNTLAAEMTKSLDAYDTVRASRPLRGFVTDLSTWYIRRSRDRFKTNGPDKDAALATTRFVLQELSKLIAPIMPFLAEDIYGKVGGPKESVHLEDWPCSAKADTQGKPAWLAKLFGGESAKPDVIAKMEETRQVVTLALEARDKASIKVRQPLGLLSIGKDLGEEYQSLVRDEVNVKEIMMDINLKDEIMLDTKITAELKEEGMVRELIRAIQTVRKKENLKPGQKVALIVSVSSAGDSTESSRAESRGQDFINKHKEEIVTATHLSDITFADGGTHEAKVEDMIFAFAI